jgi:death-on-curing family protein
VSLLWPGTDPIGKNEQRSRNLIESAAARPFQSAFEQDAYPSVLEKAIALFHSLIANHAFLNGNKRTAVIAFDHFLVANGYFLFLNNDAMYKLAEQTASYKQRGLTQDQVLEEIRSSVEDYMIPIDRVGAEAKKNSKFVDLYGSILTVRRSVRRDRRNQLVL